VESGTGRGEEGVGREARAGAVGSPLVTQKARVGVDVAEAYGITRSRLSGAVLRISAVGVLRPQTVKDEGWAARALSRVGVAVAELRRPRKIEEVVVEGLAGAGRHSNCDDGCCATRARRGLGRWAWVRIARDEEEKKDQQQRSRVLLHGGSISGSTLCVSGVSKHSVRSK